MRKRFQHLTAMFLLCLPLLLSSKPAQHSWTDSLPRLSPRPDAVAGVSPEAVSLNGTWQFKAPGIAGNKIQVPGEWEMQGFHLDSAATGTYTRQFTIPAGWKDKRVKLRFDAVSSYCTIRVNGHEIGHHEGSFVPFELDITHAVKPGENQLEVAVQCQTISDVLACTSQYAGHPVGGILRKVSLFVLPDVNLGALNYVTRFDAQYRDATLQIPLTVYNEGTKAGKAQVTFQLQDASGRTVRLPRKQFSLGTIAGGSSREDTLSLQVTNPEKWNPEHPYRYTLVTRLEVDGKLAESHALKIGFRQVEVRGNQLFVNNHPVKLHGVCRHSIAPYTGRSVSPELCVEDAKLFREGNCNYIRTSHYPPEEEFLNACDSLGLFVESESSLCWIGHGAAPIWKIWDFSDPRFLPYMIQANKEKMIADRNHPSVIMWSLGNESVWSPLWEKVNQTVKQLDPSRPTVFQDQSWGSYNNAGSRTDIGNYHYPDFTGAASTDTMDRPTQFDEFAHVENYNRLEVLTDPYIRTAWGPSLARIYDSMYLHPGCLGGAIWAGIDDIFHMPDQRLIGYGPWGVIDGWRRKKPEFYGMKQAFAPVVVTNIDHPVLQDGQLVLKTENRYDFLNLAALDIECHQGKEVRRIHGNIPPHGTGVLRIPITTNDAKDSIWVTFRDPRGFICQQVVVPPFSGVKRGPQATVTLPKVTFTSQADHYIIQAKEASYTINRQSGLLEKAQIGDALIPVSTPALMIVPLNNDDGGGPGITNCNYQTNLPPLMYQPYDEWKASAVSAAQEPDGTVRVTVEGAYTEARGTLIMHFQRDGTLEMHYSFTIQDTTRVNPRQWGLMCTLPRSFDRLQWKRKGHWSAYPSWDIARNTGEALARPAARSNSLTWSKPAASWAEDANTLGTNDFRSTKANIYQASLTDNRGAGLEVLSDGSQGVRTWIDGDRVFLLTTGYNTGGSDHFSGFFYRAERRPLKPGSQIAGTLHIKLLNSEKSNIR